MADFQVGNYSALINDLNDRIASPPMVDVQKLLGDPIKSYADGRNQKNAWEVEANRKKAISDLPRGPDGTINYGEAASRLLSIGDLEGGKGFAQLAQADADRKRMSGQFDTQMAFNRSQAAQAQLNADRAFGFQMSQANRKETPAGFEANPAGGIRPIPGGPQDPRYLASVKDAKGGDRNMSAGDITKLSEEGGKYANVANFGKSFSDNFAGYGSQTTGNMAMTAGRYLPNWVPGAASEQAASWWQGYDRYKNVVRNDQFGSALTAPEKAAFEQADINPGMKPEMIKKNLAVQEKILKGSMSRKAQAMLDAGYGMDQITSAYGVTADDLGLRPKQRPGQQGQPQAQAPVQSQQPSKYSEGQRARNPQTGQTLIFRNGSWVAE